MLKTGRSLIVTHVTATTNKKSSGPRPASWVAACLIAFGSIPVALAQEAAPQQAPMLAERVEAGNLPPIEERLPTNPLVIDYNAVGQYGGTLRTIINAADASYMDTTYGYEHLVVWAPTVDEVVPNVAESWEAAEDGRSYTFKLREGMKWSDGDPFDAQDILFWYNDVYRMTDLPRESERPVRDAVGFEVTAIDDYTVEFTFEEPYGVLLRQLATPDGRFVTNYPAHYLEQFHIDYNPEADTEAKAEGFADWIARFNEMADAWINTERPVINPWVVERPITDVRQASLARNPYYWKADAEGNQLPYIDRVVLEAVADQEVMLLKVLNGEIDFLPRYINTFVNLPVLVENQEQANYRLVPQATSSGNYANINLNQTVQDETIREFFSNRQVRIALSHAMDRQALIDLIFASQGTPFQIAMRPESEFYNEQLATQYTEYDPDLANQLLDEAGYDQRDDDGMRLSPDGEPLTFVVTVREDRPVFLDLMEGITDYWQQVGVDARFRVVERSFYLSEREANQHQAIINDGDAGMADALILPRHFVPMDPDAGWATGWYQWYVDNSQGTEPPEDIKRMYELYSDLRSTTDLEEEARIFREILQISADNFWTMGIGLPVPGYAIIADNLQNVENLQLSMRLTLAGPSRPEQYFFSQ